MPYRALGQDWRTISDATLMEAARAGVWLEEWAAATDAGAADNLLLDILPRDGEPSTWTHYPVGDVFDTQSRCQYYYHSHPESERPGWEHGHLHLFHRPDPALPETPEPLLAEGLSHMPGQTRPLPPPKDRVAHLAALGLNAEGKPLRWFTTNAWVTGETWYASRDVSRWLAPFQVVGNRPSPEVNRWITCMVRLHVPWLIRLLQERDRCLGALALQPLRQKPVLDDQSIEVASELPVDISLARSMVAEELARRGLSLD